MRRKPEELKQANEFTSREQVALIVLIIILRIVRPTQWSHEIDDEIKSLMAAIRK